MITKLLNFIKNRLFNKNLDIQVKAFNVVALAGIAVCFALLIYGLVVGEDYSVVASYLVGIVFSVAMLHYTLKTGKYDIAMMITVVVVFLGLFTFVFFNGGGYKSGAPIFFVLAMVFTAFLLKKKVANVFIVTEIIWYIAICIFAYMHPEYVVAFQTDKEIMIDIISCAVICGLILANTMYQLVSVYRNKQDELEKAKEDAEKANNSKSKFLAKMSHDIRTPINTIAVMNELIAKNTDSDQIKEWTADSDTSCTILLSLINDMLDISKIEAGKVDIHGANFTFKDLAGKLYVAWNNEATKKGLNLRFNINKNLPKTVYGSEDAIFKVLSNLLSNAIKYSDKGTITFSIDKIDDEFVFVVKDEGIGIPDEFLAKIFKPFERGAQEYYHNHEGSGLGLAIVKELSEQMSAKIDCDSELEKGSTFTFSINLKVVDEAPLGVVDFTNGTTNNSSQNQEDLDEDIVFPGGNILVVDDNFYNRKVLRALLEPMLFQIDDVESGEEAIEMVEIKDYDLILMDYRMPDMSGKETLMCIFENDPNFKVPVVCVTADAMLGTKEELLESGFNDFITKPINSNQLKDVLKTFVSDKLKYIEKEVKCNLSEEKIEDLYEIIKPYGINLKSALAINSNSLEELKIRLEFFLEYFENTKNDLCEEQNAELEDAVFFVVHSLKSSANGIGAEALAQISSLIELKKDTKFYEEMKPFLLREYDLAKEGCELLKAELLKE